jgi:hypothetical protein
MTDHSDHYDACLRGANAALDAFRRGGAGGPVLRKLTLYKDRSCNCYRRSIVSFVLAHPAAARVEELCVDYKESTMYRDAVQLAALSCAATLRVLEIAYCDIKMAPSASAARRAFPRLTSLVLRNCVLPEGNLQDVVDAAPQLASLHLQEVLHEMADVDPKVTYDGGPPRDACFVSGSALRRSPPSSSACATATGTALEASPQFPIMASTSTCRTSKSAATEDAGFGSR